MVGPASRYPRLGWSRLRPADGHSRATTADDRDCCAQGTICLAYTQVLYDVYSAVAHPRMEGPDDQLLASCPKASATHNLTWQPPSQHTLVTLAAHCEYIAWERGHKMRYLNSLIPLPPSPHLRKWPPPVQMSLHLDSSPPSNESGGSCARVNPKRLWSSIMKPLSPL